ncbi:MAG: hypothetical protein U9Q07_02810 [Planctomycetota bacterium]|nr:hypothetical protein [Planctomycetota bacterium]
MILGSKIDKRFVNASLETCRVDDANRRAIECAKKIVAGDLGGMILGGPVGTGKTHIMVATMNDIEAKNLPVLREMDDGLEAYSPCHTYYYWKAADFATALLRQAIANDADPVRDAKTAELLFIDDLGTEYQKAGSNYIYTAFQTIFDYRWGNELPIFVTTNMDAKALEKVYGERVLSRWCGSCKMLRLVGDDRRKQGEAR